MLAHTIRRARLQESFADHLSRLIEANEAARHIFEAEAGAAIRSFHTFAADTAARLDVLESNSAEAGAAIGFHTFAADTAARLDVLERKASLIAAPLQLGRRLLKSLRRS